MNLVHELVPTVMHYDWGKLGYDSLVAQLCHVNEKSEYKRPFAELWMGNHHKSPSHVIKNGVEMDIRECLGNPLPFLFKVLSIKTALSIQAHPDKKTAEKLHKMLPDLYQDSNHKPEMLVALTHFVALVGFAPLSVIRSRVFDFPELLDLSSHAKKAMTTGIELDLRTMFCQVVSQPAEIVWKVHDVLVQRLTGQVTRTPFENLVLELACQYPLDIGVFCAMFMNRVVLTSGQALFLGANEIHAYVFGDCIEIMACSDNVVRAGLTPKYRDIPTLQSILSYEPRCVGGLLIQPYKNMVTYPLTNTFLPPVKDFGLHHTIVPNGYHVKIPIISSISILLVTSGSGSLHVSDETHIIPLGKGTVLLIEPFTTLHCTCTSTMENLSIFQAFSKGTCRPFGTLASM